MKAIKIAYLITTGFFCLWMLGNAYGYLFTEEAKRLCIHFGFPSYFRVELGLAKFIGVIVLLVPLKNTIAKEWVYAGFVITLISGFIAHLVSGDPVSSAFGPLLALGLLITSYFTFHRIQITRSDTIPTL